MRFRLFLVALALLCVGGLALAAECRKAVSNPDTAGQCVAVSTTVITVMRANTSRCSAMIMNNSANPMMCRDRADGTPAANAGTPILANATLALGLESQGEWQCIRAGGSDAVACVTEGRP